MINTDGVFGTHTTLASVLAREEPASASTSTIRSKVYIKTV